jgi:hypothetical protein
MLLRCFSTWGLGLKGSVASGVCRFLLQFTIFSIISHLSTPSIKPTFVPHRRGKAVDLTTDHKPQEPGERTRIEQSGGFVCEVRPAGPAGRGVELVVGGWTGGLLAADLLALDRATCCAQSPTTWITNHQDGLLCGELAVARAIGDYHLNLKRQGSRPGAPSAAPNMHPTPWSLNSYPSFNHHLDCPPDPNPPTPPHTHPTNAPARRRHLGPPDGRA